MIAWMCVALGALVWSVAIWFCVRVPWALRVWLCLSMPVWALSPAPVENHPDEHAPAIFAVFYELFIASNGNPGAAIAVLVLGTALLTLAVGLAYIAKTYFTKSGAGH